VQIQVLIAGGAVVGRGEAIKESNIGSNIEVTKPLGFNGEAERVGGFIMACKLYLKMRMREAIVEEQI